MTACVSGELRSGDMNGRKHRRHRSWAVSVLEEQLVMVLNHSRTEEGELTRPHA